MPFSHLTLTTSHLPSSTSFFLSCLHPLGYKFIGRSDEYIGFGQNAGDPADFWITEGSSSSKTGGVGSTHIAFPSPTQDSVTEFFIRALKAGGKFHGEPRLRDGCFSAAVLDFDGNCIEAVFRPPSSSSSVNGRGDGGEGRSVVSIRPRGLIEDGSVSGSKTGRTGNVYTSPSPKPDTRSQVSATAINRNPPSAVSKSQQHIPVTNTGPNQTYTIQPPKPDNDNDSKTAKTIVGTLVGAAAGAAIAYAMTKGEGESQSDENAGADGYPRILPVQGQPQSQSQLQGGGGGGGGYKSLEAPPSQFQSQGQAQSTYTNNQLVETRNTNRSIASTSKSKNPRASTIYTEAEQQHQQPYYYPEDNGSTTSDLPLRAIEYNQPYLQSQSGVIEPCNPSTLVSSFTQGSRKSSASARYGSGNGNGNGNGNGSVYSSSTIKPPKSHSTHHSQTGSISNPAGRGGGSTASSTRTARNIPLPQSTAPSGTGSTTSYRTSQSKSKSKSGLSATPSVSASARNVPLPESTASKSIGSRTSKSSKFEEPVRPSDSISQVSMGTQRTTKPGGSRASSKR